MQNDDGPQPLPLDDVGFPGSVRAAGIVWIIFGCVILVNSAINSALTANAPGGGAPQVAGGGCSGLLGIFFGGAFIFVGVQSVRGTAKDTLGNGIGSIVIGALNVGLGALLTAAGIGLMGPGPGPASVGAVVGGGISILGGCGLIVAGVLALVCRSGYRSWRKAQIAVPR